MELLVLSHGELAKGAVTAVKMIAGHYGHIHHLGLYEEDDPKYFGKQIAEFFAQFDEDTEFLVFVDFLGGTPCNEILKVLDRKNIKSVAGFNLAMLLDAYLKLSSNVLSAQNTDELILIGRESIVDLNKRFDEILQQDVDSDF
jgi:mannose/fructose-specific phosphotransferase system component IIA